MSKKIFIAGHRGLVGSAIKRLYDTLDGWEVIAQTRQQLDLTDTSATFHFLKSEKPDAIVVAAAKVGGIKANNDAPVDFLLDNIKIQNSIIEGAYKAEIEKLLFLGSSCIYPKFAPQPMKEEHLLTGELEPTNEWYAIAKIAGIKLCQAYRKQYGCKFIAGMPTNMYGPYDNFDPITSHVLPAMIHKFHQAKAEGKEVMQLWGTGSPRREFLHSEDLANAVKVLVNDYDSSEIVNIGCGEDVTIKELAETVRSVVGYEGAIEWDSTKPDGTPRKLLDISRIKALGWEPRISLMQGITTTYEWYLENEVS